MEGMAIGLLSSFFGVLLIVIAIGLIIFASLTRRAGRRYVTSVLASVWRRFGGGRVPVERLLLPLCCTREAHPFVAADVISGASAALFLACTQGRLKELELYWPAGLLLHNNGAEADAATANQLTDADLDDVAAAQLL